MVQHWEWPLKQALELTSFPNKLWIINPPLIQSEWIGIKRSNSPRQGSGSSELSLNPNEYTWISLPLPSRAQWSQAGSSSGCHECWAFLKERIRKTALMFSNLAMISTIDTIPCEDDGKNNKTIVIMIFLITFEFLHCPHHLHLQLVDANLCIHTQSSGSTNQHSMNKIHANLQCQQVITFICIVLLHEILIRETP